MPTNAMTSAHVPVLIVGGGPVGLALASELGFQGCACLLVERGDGRVVTPKMNEVNTRSMELVRRWGIADQVLDTPFPLDWPKDVVFVTTLRGHEIGRIPRPPRQQRASPFSPETVQTCSQTWFDPILQQFARAQAGVRLRYRCRLERFEESPTHVTATLVDEATGAPETITADYLVGCDGAGSTVRRALGVGLTGLGASGSVSLGTALNMFFRAPGLLEACGRAPGTFFIMADAVGVWGNLRIIDPKQAVWRLMVNAADPDTTAASIDRAAHLRRAIGRDVAVEWIEASVWHRRSVLADSYGGVGAHPRVLLAGDAVHQVSPTGALGMNTGIGDAVDLGWKLAAVHAGWGGRQLVASYDAERRPVGRRNVTMATTFHGLHKGYEDLDLALLTAPGAAADAVRETLGQRLVARLGAEFRTIGLQIGYVYEGSPVVIADATSPLPDTPETYQPSARPGARAPHLWLGDGRSSLDLYGRDFVLLRLGRQPPDAGPLEQAAARRGVPLTLVSIASDEALALHERSLVLVRPDGHVAWRGDSMPADPIALIDHVRGA